MIRYKIIFNSIAKLVINIYCRLYNYNIIKLVTNIFNINTRIFLKILYFLLVTL